MENIIIGYSQAINAPSEQPPAVPEDSFSGNTDVETRVYNYEPPYTRPTENIEDQQLDGEQE